MNLRVETPNVSELITSCLFIILATHSTGDVISALWRHSDYDVIKAHWKPMHRWKAGTVILRYTAFKLADDMFPVGRELTMRAYHTLSQVLRNKWIRIMLRCAHIISWNYTSRLNAVYSLTPQVYCANATWCHSRAPCHDIGRCDQHDLELTWNCSSTHLELL